MEKKEEYKFKKRHLISGIDYSYSVLFGHESKYKPYFFSQN
jgi:hypothetical protein